MTFSIDEALRSGAFSRQQAETLLRIYNALADLVGGGGGGGVTDHGALTGLADDDHPQYHNDARGDLRYAAIGHAHTGVYDPAGSAAAAQANAIQRANHTGTQVAATISDFSEAVDDRVFALLVQGSGITLTYDDAAGTLTIAASGGSDPWTYAKLASDFTTSSSTAVDVTGLSFTPAANKSYEFEGLLRTRTATATVGPRPGLAWPTGTTDGVAGIDMTSSATARLLVNGNPGAALLAAVGGLPNTTSSYPAWISGNVTMGASPSGSVKVQLASETAGTTVTIRAGSYIRYREIP